LESGRAIMKRKEYASQRLYRENNPSITFRLKKEDKEKLDAIIEATGKPLSQWMTDFIHEKMAPYEENSKLVKRINLADEKIKELLNEEKFHIPCVICGKPILFSSRKSNWEADIYPLLKILFTGWCHGNCMSK
jgi:predicted DNA-binding protein